MPKNGLKQAKIGHFGRKNPKNRRFLHAGRQFGGHGLPAIATASVDDERAVADRMEGAGFLPAG